MTQLKNGPTLKYPGAKWRLADWIIQHLPPHTTFVEPYFGSGAVFFNKPPSKSEYINDLDGEICNLFQVMREQPERLAMLVDLTPYSRDEYELAYEPTVEPIEQARRTLARHWMSMAGNGGVRQGMALGGWRHAGAKAGRSVSPPKDWENIPLRILSHARRLKGAHIENRPALELLGRLNHPTVLAYVDPPYHPATRKGRMYREEMFVEAQHVELLEFLANDWQGMCVLSGYPHPLYDDLLPGWARVERQAGAEMGQSRTEVLWLNPAAEKRGLFGSQA